MAQLIDFSTARLEDAVLTISMVPGQSISGWTVRYLEQPRFGGLSGQVQKWLASGYANNQSGITLVDGSIGRLNVNLYSAESSGIQFGNYAFAVERMDSGFRTVIAEGFRMYQPAVAP